MHRIMLALMLSLSTLSADTWLNATMAVNRPFDAGDYTFKQGFGYGFAIQHEFLLNRRHLLGFRLGFDTFSNQLDNFAFQGTRIDLKSSSIVIGMVYGFMVDMPIYPELTLAAINRSSNGEDGAVRVSAAAWGFLGALAAKWPLTDYLRSEVRISFADSRNSTAWGTLQVREAILEIGLELLILQSD
jgi:hypothetical protein